MARRRRSQARTNVRASGRRRGRFSYMDLQARHDCIIAGGYINNSGVQTAAVGWSPTSLVLAAGTQCAFQAVVIPAAATAINAPPSVGQCEVDQIEGSFFLSTPTAAGLYYFGVGIYISKYDQRTGTWGIRYPSNVGADAARDDWLLLKAFVATLPLPASVTDPMVIELKLALPHPVLLGGGESLHCCVDNNTSSAGSISVASFFRAHISNVV